MRYTKKQKEELLKVLERDITDAENFIQFLSLLRVVHNESLFVNSETENLKPISDWVRSLRSGNFVQGKNSLFINQDATVTSSYCCLGVLAATFKTEEFQNRFKKTYGKLTKPYFLYSEVGDMKFEIAKSVLKLVRINPEQPKIPWGNLSLAKLNDFWGLSFEQIADQIKADLILIKEQRKKQDGNN